MDVEAEKNGLTVDEDMLLFIHGHKTAALIQAAMVCATILAGASKEHTDIIEEISYNIGLAFQIQDDVLDVTGDSTAMGKTVGKDAKNNKTTYASLHGVPGASAKQWDLSSGALRALSSYSRRNMFLEELVRSLITRRY